MKMYLMTVSSLVLLSACSVTPERVTEYRQDVNPPVSRVSTIKEAPRASVAPISDAPSLSGGIPILRYDAIPNASKVTLPKYDEVDPPKSETVGSLDIRNIQVCDAGYVVAEVLSIPVSCSGFGKIDLIFPAMTTERFREASVKALSTAGDVNIENGVLSIVGTGDSPDSGIGVTGAISSQSSVKEGKTVVINNARPGEKIEKPRSNVTKIIDGADIESAQDLARAFSIDVNLTESTNGVRAVGLSSDVNKIASFFADSDTVNFSGYVPGLSDGYESLKALYPEGFSYDTSKGIVQIKMPRREASSLVSRFNDYLSPRKQVIVTAYIVDSRDDLSSIFSSSIERVEPTISGGIVSVFGNLAPVLKALDSTSGTTILSQPSMTVRDGSTGHARVGDRIPITKSVVSDGVTTQDVEYLDTGVILDVTPTIRSDGSVMLSVNVETSYAADENGASAPRISTRSANTELQLMSGDTIAISGLRGSQGSNLSSGIPGLTQIAAGGTNSSSLSSSYLTIFINVKVM